jgi:hypothetical protein
MTNMMGGSDEDGRGIDIGDSEEQRPQKPIVGPGLS